MTKTLTYDLHFKDGVVIPRTNKAEKFLRLYSENSHRLIYKHAVERGLHCSFETAEIRNNLSN